MFVSFNYVFLITIFRLLDGFIMTTNKIFKIVNYFITNILVKIKLKIILFHLLMKYFSCLSFNNKQKFIYHIVLTWSIASYNRYGIHYSKTLTDMSPNLADKRQALRPLIIWNV